MDTCKRGALHFSRHTRSVWVSVTLYTSSVALVLILNRSVFNDFGPEFTCVDPTVEQPFTGMIVSVDKVTPNIYYKFVR